MESGCQWTRNRIYHTYGSSSFRFPSRLLKIDVWNSPKHDHECCHFESRSLCQWRHKQGGHERVAKVSNCVTIKSFFSALLEEKPFNAKRSFWQSYNLRTIHPTDWLIWSFQSSAFCLFTACIIVFCSLIFSDSYRGDAMSVCNVVSALPGTWTRPVFGR